MMERRGPGRPEKLTDDMALDIGEWIKQHPKWTDKDIRQEIAKKYAPGLIQTLRELHPDWKLTYISGYVRTKILPGVSAIQKRRKKIEVNNKKPNELLQTWHLGLLATYPNITGETVKRILALQRDRQKKPLIPAFTLEKQVTLGEALWISRLYNVIPERYLMQWVKEYYLNELYCKSADVPFRILATELDEYLAENPNRPPPRREGRGMVLMRRTNKSEWELPPDNGIMTIRRTNKSER